jgi:hypothetical protein
VSEAIISAAVPEPPMPVHTHAAGEGQPASPVAPAWRRPAQFRIPALGPGVRLDLVGLRWITRLRVLLWGEIRLRVEP